MMSNLLGMMYEDQARRLSRTTDPETSKEAAASVAPKLSALQERVLTFAVACGPTGFTDREMVKAMGVGSDSTWRTRRSELVKRGLIEDTGITTREINGRRHTIWRVVPHGDHD